jgi:hypothetical protein
MSEVGHAMEDTVRRHDRDADKEESVDLYLQNA